MKLTWWPILELRLIHGPSARLPAPAEDPRLCRWSLALLLLRPHRRVVVYNTFARCLDSYRQAGKVQTFRTFGARSARTLKELRPTMP
eukprot:1133404-Amphidinium_carterae.1